MSAARSPDGGKTHSASRRVLEGQSELALLDGHQPDGLRPDVALAEQVRQLDIQVAHLELALRSQRQIGVAIGLVAQRFGCTTDQAWRVLVRLSQNTNIKVREVARLLCEAFDGVSKSEDSELLRVLAVQMPASGWPGIPTVPHVEVDASSGNREDA
jgi:hypothetical protein